MIKDKAKNLVLGAQIKFEKHGAEGKKYKFKNSLN